MHWPVRLLFPLPFLAAGLAIWWPVLHLFVRPSQDFASAPSERLGEAEKSAARLAQLWGEGDDGTVDQMRIGNPEWDFMARTFYVLGLANLALHQPGSEARCLARIDAIIKDTIAREAAHGQAYYLMPYHAAKPWVDQPPRSVFVDGEIALCLAARRLVSDDDPGTRDDFARRVEIVRERMGRSPCLNAESYPDECWLFCNSIGAACLLLSDALDSTDHRPFVDRWLAETRARFTDPGTGILIATYTLDGQPHPAGEGPEGSTIWLAAHMLRLIDPAFARDQYDRSVEALGGSLFGFGYSREWPRGYGTSMDVDSGIVIPGFGASASASGLYLVAAASFEDAETYRELWAGLEFAGFPDEGGGWFQAAGGIGNAVIFHSLVAGPLWERAASLIPRQQ